LPRGFALPTGVVGHRTTLPSRDRSRLEFFCALVMSPRFARDTSTRAGRLRTRRRALLLRGLGRRRSHPEAGKHHRRDARGKREQETRSDQTRRALCSRLRYVRLAPRPHRFLV
jgi:hypothetical protein